MLNEIIELFFKIAPWIIFFPLILSLKNFRKSPSELKIITQYLILSVITQIVSFIFWKRNINNLPVLHIYTLLEFAVLLWFYYKILKSFIPKIYFYILLIAFVVFALTDTFLLEGVYVFNTYSRSVEGFIFIVLSVFWFFKVFFAEEESYLPYQKSINYISAGFFIYFSGSIVLFSFSNYINQLAHSMLFNIWTLHTLFLTIMYILLFRGLWRVKTK